MRDRTSDVEALAKIKWNLDHYGPLDAEPFQWSRFESPAHAALEAVREAGWLPPDEVARRVDEALTEVERRISDARPRVIGPLDAVRIVRAYREEVRHG